MKKILTLALATTILSASAMAADEFGSRFGESSPYALDNTVDDAIADTNGFDMNDINDLNAIAPAAGDEETDAEVTSETDVEVTTEEDGEVSVDTDVEAGAEHDHAHGDDHEHDHDHTDGEHDSETEIDVEVESDAEVE